MGVDITTPIGQIVVTAYPTCDMHDGVTAAQGMDLYTVDVDGAQTTYPAPATEIAVQPVFYAVGATGSMVQSGRDFLLTSNGSGRQGTSDEFCGAGRQVTGDFNAFVEVSSFLGSGYAYAQAWLGLRDCTPANIASTPGARYGSIGLWRSAGGFDYNGRSVASAIYDTGANNPGTGAPGFLHVNRTGNVLTYRYSQDNRAFFTLGVQTITAGSTIMLLFGVSDAQSPSQVMTATFRNFHVTQSATIVHTINTVSTTPKVIKVKARDLALNETAYTPTQSAVPGVAPSGGIRFSPGLSPTFDFALPFASDNASWVGIESLIANVGSLALVKSLQFILPIGVYSSNAQGDYTTGRAVLTRLDAAMTALGKPYYLHIRERKNGTRKVAPQTATDRDFADWMLSTPGIVISKTDFNILRIWGTAGMDILIGIWDDIISFASTHPLLHGIETSETTSDSRIEAADIDHPTQAEMNAYNLGYRTQWYRMINYFDQAHNNGVQRICCFNYFDSADDAGLANSIVLRNLLRDKGWGMGCPDILTFDLNWGSSIHIGRGIVDYGGGYIRNYGTTPSIGVMSSNGHHEYLGDYSKESIQDCSRNIIHNNRMVLAYAPWFAGQQTQTGPASQANGWDAWYSYLASLSGTICDETRPSNMP